MVSPGLLHSSAQWGQVQGGLVPIQFQLGQCMGCLEPCQLHSRVDLKGLGQQGTDSRTTECLENIFQGQAKPPTSSDQNPRQICCPGIWASWCITTLGRGLIHLTVYMKSARRLGQYTACATVCNKLLGRSCRSSQVHGIQNSRALSNEGGRLGNSSSGESPHSLWFRHTPRITQVPPRECQCIPVLCEQR